MNREATIFYATPAKAPDTHTFYKILIANNLQKTPVSRPEKSLPKKGNFYGKQMLSGDAARSRKNAA